MSSCGVLGMALLMVGLEEEDVRPFCRSGRDDVVEVRVAGTEDRCTRLLERESSRSGVAVLLREDEREDRPVVSS